MPQRFCCFFTALGKTVFSKGNHPKENLARFARQKNHYFRKSGGNLWKLESNPFEKIILPENCLFEKDPEFKSDPFGKHSFVSKTIFRVQKLFCFSPPGPFEKNSNFISKRTVVCKVGDGAPK